MRSTIYWLLSILMLLLCLTFSLAEPNKTAANPIALTSHLDVEPSFIYYNNGLFHVKVYGQLKIAIKTDQIEENISQFDALIIEGFHFNREVEFSLNWQVKEQKHNLQLNQTTESINQINFHTENTSDITDLHLLININQELGNINKLYDEVSFHSIHLDHLSNYSQIATNLSEWNDFNSLKFSSINGFTNSFDLNYQDLIFRLSIWIIMSILIFRLLNIKGLHLLSTLFLAWGISSYFYLNNFINQHNQISDSISENSYINQLDQEAAELANSILTFIESTPGLFLDKHKYILIGSNTFFKLRLVYHLNFLNIALDIDILKLLETPNNSQFQYLLTDEQLLLCDNKPENNWLMNQVEIVFINDDFCLLRKK